MVSRSRSRKQGLVGSAVFCALSICCIPCIVLGIGGLCSLIYTAFHAAINYQLPRTRRRQEEREAEEKRARNERIQAPRILGPRLQGALTIGREVQEVTELANRRGVIPSPKKTEDQLQSPLFRLPLEVRRQIYEDTIGGYLIHIYYLEAYKRIGHVRCKTPHGGVCTCRYLYKQKGVSDGFGNVDLLAPLKSCRKLYSEGIEILYSCNTFDFDYLGNVLKLSLMILPERMRLIEKVQWEYYHEYGILSSIATASNATRVPTPMLSTSRPWYICRTPAKCPCLDCWSKSYLNDLANHKFIIYDWVMPPANLYWTSDPED